MAPKRGIPKFELYRRVQRLRDDPEPPISFKMLAELAGVSYTIMYEIFVANRAPLTEYVQIRLTRAFEKLERGDVVVVRNKDQTKSIKYLNEPKPRMRRSMGLTVEGGEIKLKVGIRNRGDYSGPTFREQMDGDE